MEKFFKLKQNNTTVGTEIIAGITTFFTMAYILIINPIILGATGMPQGGVFLATIFAAVIGTLVMGLFANVPYALAPGMGLNVFFATTVVALNGFSWQEALGMVFICGVINILITFTKIRKSIIKSIPENLQHAIGGGIGLFIAYVGCQSIGLINFDQGVPALSTFNSPQMLLALAGILIMIILVILNIKGAILIGIVLTTILGIFANIVDITAINFSDYGTMFTDFGSIFGKAVSSEGLGGLFQDSSRIGFVFMTIFAFSLTDTFDTIGTFIGTGRKSGIFSAEDELELDNGKGFSSKMDKALFADSVATSIGAILGTSNTTTYVESSAGIGAGGRTGLTAVVVAFCFLISIILGPFFAIIPNAATAPALIIVGVMMTSSFKEIKWDELEEAIPCFFTALFMAIAYSISTGIALGFITYVVVKIAKKKWKEIHPILFVATILFVINFIVTSLV